MSQQSIQKPKLMDSIIAEALEQKLVSSGAISATLSAVDGKIYPTDARDFIDKKDWLVDIPTMVQGKNFTAAGEIDKADKLKIFSDSYFTLLADYNRINQILENTHTPYARIAGASGAEATTNYETTRRINDLAKVTGQQYNMEDHTAKHAVMMESVSELRFRFHKKTSNRLKVQKSIGDEVVPDIARQAFISDNFEIFADAFHYTFSMRDQKEQVFPIQAEIQKEIPGAFEQAKHDDITKLLNAAPATNQGDWDALSGNFYPDSAAEQIQTAEDAIKKFGRPLIAQMSSKVWRAYQRNMQGAFLFNENKANKSTSTAETKSGPLEGNPGVQYWINDDITADAYVLVSLSSFIRGFQGAVIQTSYKNSKTPGQAEGRLTFDFHGFTENENSAAFKGTTVTA